MAGPRSYEYTLAHHCCMRVHLSPMQSDQYLSLGTIMLRHLLTDKKFGRLIALKVIGVDIRRRVIWSCLCTCGRKCKVPAGILVSGRTRSCGCLRAELVRTYSVTHGQARSREYKIWRGMKSRCYNPRQENYKHYGGRGIQVCKRWLNSFENFLSDMGPAPINNELDRKNNDGNYTPKNCRWITHLENCHNKRKRQKLR